MESSIDDFVEFEFACSFYLHRMSVFLDFCGELAVLVRFEKGDVAGIVYLHRGWKGQLISARLNSCQDFELSDFLLLQFVRYLCDVDVVL